MEHAPLGDGGKVVLVTGVGFSFCHERVCVSVRLLELLVSKLLGEVFVDLRSTKITCAPQKLHPRGLRRGVRKFEVVFVMEPAENRLADDCSLARKSVPVRQRRDWKLRGRFR